MTTERVLFEGGRIATLAGEVYDDGALWVEGGRIQRMGPTAAVKTGFRGQRVDLRGRLVLPGLINAHHHLYSTLARGMPSLPGPAAKDFTGVLEQVWWPLDRALSLSDVYLSALFGLLECARHGVTTVIDHHASEGAIPGSLEEIARAADDVGLRVATCFEVTDRDGPEVTAAGLAENARFARAVAADPRPRGAVPTLAATLGLHASFTLSDATLLHARELREQLGLPGVHVHVAEDRADPAHALKVSGVRTVERLHRAGLLGPGTLAVHAVWVDDAEVARLAETETLVVVNPSSNLNNAVGRSDTGRLLQAGVRVGVGSDGMTGDWLHELVQCFLVRRDAAADPRVGWDEVGQLAAGTRAVGDVFFPGAGLGTLREGGPADFAVYDYDPWTPLDADTLLGHLLYGGLGPRARTVVCGGRVVLLDGEPPGLDLAQLSARAREAAAALWSRRRGANP
ncbi:MAG: amidohydrolase family protein [Planctomycetes bacterium]|nr:amidohydrolase family protein [Planctomycetota bacterium]